MATANINVNKQNVLQLLTSGQEIPFVIPEYQRPYSWSDDEIITLFEDLWEFSIERTHSDGAKNYFLGCVVSYEENGERQIIDGQQRITSLFLLLRAVFSMLEKEDNKTDEVNNFIQKIKPALWKENEMTGKEDRSKILLRSEVLSFATFLKVAKLIRMQRTITLRTIISSKNCTFRSRKAALTRYTISCLLC